MRTFNNLVFFGSLIGMSAFFYYMIQGLNL